MLPLQRNESEFEGFVKTHERRIRLALCAAYGTDLGIEASAEAFALAWERWEKAQATATFFAAEVDALARETTMATDQSVIPIDRDENDTKKSPWLRVGALVGAAAVIIASIVGLTVLRSESDAIAAPPFATAEDAARAREHAVGVGDWDAFRAVFADEGVDVYYTSNRPFSVNEERAEARFAYNVALGQQSVVESCSVSSKDSVTCTVVVTDDVIQALGAEAIVESREFRISEGLLAFVGIPTVVDSPPIVDSFWEWLGETNHRVVALQIEFSRRPVIVDAPVVAAARLEATDEFLAQYDGRSTVETKRWRAVG